MSAAADNAILKSSPMNLYITTCRYIAEADPYDAETWLELYIYLPHLRRVLSCCVCARILCQPAGPPDGVCGHYVCRGCVGGRMRLWPACAWCREHHLFVDDCALRIVVRCFAKICEYLADSPIAGILTDATVNGQRADEASHLLAVIQEGITAGSDIKTESETLSESTSTAFLPKTQPVVRANGDCVTDDVPDDVPSSSNHDDGDSDHVIVDVTGGGADIVMSHPTTERVACDDAPSRKRKHSEVIKTNSHNEGGKTNREGGKSNGKSLSRAGHCRCGLATRNPGMLTCRGQRCPCYSAFRGCVVDCQCRGCRNPRGDTQSATASRGADNDLVRL